MASKKSNGGSLIFAVGGKAIRGPLGHFVAGRLAGLTLINGAVG